MEITDEDGDAIDEKRSTSKLMQMVILTILLEISSPITKNRLCCNPHKKIWSGQNAMTDCSSCEEESTTETDLLYKMFVNTTFTHEN